MQTMEFDLCRNNILASKTQTTQNFLFKYVLVSYPIEMAEVTAFMGTLPEDLSDAEQEKIAVLVWKCLPGKAVLAQDFSYHILENIDDAKANFVVPKYIQAAFTHLTS